MENNENQKDLEEKKEIIFLENEKKIKLDSHTIKLVLVVVFAIIATAFISYFTTINFQSERQAQKDAEYQKQLSDLRSKQLSQLQQNQNLPISAVNNQENSTSEPIPSNKIEPGMIKLDKINVKWKDELTSCDENYGNGGSCYLVGNIKSQGTIYDGLPFYLEVTYEMAYSFRHFTMLNGQVLYAESEDPDTKSSIIVGINDIPEKISFPGSSYKLLKNSYVRDLFSELGGEKKIFSNELGDFFLTEKGCLMVELPDHTAISYNFNIPFVNEEKSELDVKFNNGKNNKDTYGFIMHTCGSSCTLFNTVDESELSPDERLEIVGKTSNGEDIYGMKNPADQHLIDLYNNKNTMAYINTDGNNNYADEKKNKYTYEEFVNSHPYLYWKDPLGRWVEFLNRKYDSAAEMCKPVVYLYPESKIELNMKVSPNGGFTHTEPAYDNGWNVEANPNGKIKDLKSGNFYDYLLWEGLGIDYPDSSKGWVVEKDNLNSFFDEKLHQLGLNRREIGDFKEYWLGRMNEKPYYKIYFLSNAEFNLLAPVEFSPTKPDTFIRVMMTAKGLDNFENIPQQILPKMIPERKGFSAVEWGGTLNE
ncbi:MAG TPA: hypothetical protein P5323_01230 [Candidatus Moranbacteria bacterium]|nr:hypothetical protein [Candidatus Moranbacteria bacterium]HRY27736.1 hypothetical protein [Candidatus Moranbacteria bacterium]HSA08533.1 hypothetical protein [Candidatus Moranbacteria bacterium]